MRAACRLLLLVAALLVSALAGAHKASDAYLQLVADERGLALRWDIALRDLDAAIALDADDDGRLTWGEVRAGLATHRCLRTAASADRRVPAANHRPQS